MPNKKATQKKKLKAQTKSKQDKTKKEKKPPKKTIKEKKKVDSKIVDLKLGKRSSKEDKQIEKPIEKPQKRKVALKNISPENMQLIKKEGQKTLIEIIEDSRSGIPAKSEIENKEKKAFLKKNKRDQKINSKLSQQAGGDGQQSETSNIQQKQFSQISSHDSQPSQISPVNQQQNQPISKPKLVMIDGKLQIQAPVLNIQSRDNALALANQNREITVVNSNNQKLSSLSFMKRQPAEKWKTEETDKFYMALQIFGTDFSLIEKIFNGTRSREQIKVSLVFILNTTMQNKFRKEERKNKNFIDQILQNKEGLSLKTFEEKYGPIHLGEEFQESEQSDSDISSSCDNSDNESSGSSDHETSNEKSDQQSNEQSSSNQDSNQKPQFGNLLGLNFNQSPFANSKDLNFRNQFINGNNATKKSYINTF